MEELIDVLDENGEKTGKVVTRKEVHSKGFWHRVVAIAIIDKNGNILMQQRSKNVETNKLKWDITAAGHISAGQTSVEAALRETFEEVGINIKPEELKYIFSYKHANKLDNQFFDFYLVVRNEIKLDQVKTQESEVEQVKICGAYELQNMIDRKEVVNRDNVYRELFKYLK